MFSKKKKNSNIIDFIYESSNKRQAFRVTPPMNYLVLMHLDGNEENRLPVKDISCGGVSFESKGFKLNSAHRVVIEFPNELNKVYAEVKILHISEDGRCHCSFLNLNRRAENRIYHYVLEVQKKHLK